MTLPCVLCGLLCFGRITVPATGRSALAQSRGRRTGVPPGYLLGRRRRELCAACGMQASNNGGLVGIYDSGIGHVSVVGSTLTSITVRAHCFSTP